MDEYMYSLEEATVFSRLDASFGFWQIQIDESERNEAHYRPIMTCIGLPRCHLGSTTP